MTKRDLIMAGGVAALGLALIALPSPSATPQDPDTAKLAQTEQKMEELQARMAGRLEGAQERIAEHVQTRAFQASMRAAIQEAQEQQRKMERTPEADEPDTMVFL